MKATEVRIERSPAPSETDASETQSIANSPIEPVPRTAIAFLGSGSVGLFTIDWAGLASVSLGAGLLSILTSVAFKKD